MICIICKKKAKWSFSPDLDIEGLGACSKHKIDVGDAYMMLCLGNREMYQTLITGNKDYKK